MDVRFPDGSPVAKMPVRIEMRGGDAKELTTDEDGTVIAPFSLNNVQQVTFDVSILNVGKM